MKITAVETLRTEEFANVLWVRIHTDGEIVGLGETFYGAGAVEAHIHDTLAGRIIGRNPLHIEAIHREMLNLPMAQSSTGAEYRAASAVDIALWDIFGKVCGQPVHQMLGGLCRERQRIYNTCAGYRYVRSQNIKPVSNWNLGEEAGGPYEDLDGFMNRADAVAESLLESGITAMKIWPFDPAAIENHGLHITAEQMKTAIEPVREDQEGGRRPDRDHGGVPLPVEPADGQADRPGARALQADLVRGPDPDELAPGARASTPARRTSGSAPARRSAPASPTRSSSTATPSGVVMADLCWTGGLTEGRKIAALAETFHRPFAPHDCIGPVGFVAAIHASFSQPNTLIQESVRAFYTGWYKELVTDHAGDQGRLRAPDGGRRPLHRAPARGVRPPRSHRPAFAPP